MEMLGERIRQVRELEGWTQGELALRSGVVQSAIAQIEAGVFEPSDAVIAGIALATGFDVDFFRQGPPANFPLGAFLYRAQAKVSAKDKARSHRLTQIMFECALKMRAKLKPIPILVPRTFEGPNAAAALARSSMALSPNTPIPNLSSAIERLGVLILPIASDVAGLDGFSAWVGVNADVPVMSLVQGGIGYRQRFTMAEELGHLIMHFPLRVSAKEADEEARLFAGELMLPEEAFRLELPNPVTLTGLTTMKRRWKVSYQFLIRRAHDLGAITPNQYRYLNMQISSRDWKKHEPGDETVQQEEPVAFRKMISLIYGSPADQRKLQKDLGGIPAKLVRQLLMMSPTKPAKVTEFPNRRIVPTS